jgi:4-alpha-glucanotransferase
MSLFRLLWIPPGMAAVDGAYVSYPAQELLAILTLESVKRRTLIVGEDLGTVPPFIRRDLAKNAVLSYKVFYFERGEEGRFLPPEDYPALAVAAVTTHDLPTLAGFWEGRDLELRCEHKFYCQPEQAEADRAARSHDRRLLVEALHSRGLLSEEPGFSPPGPCPSPVRLGVLEYLAQSPAALLEVRLEEVFGFVEQQNLPGTTSEHPNWRLRLPLTLEEMAQSPEPARVAARLNQYRSR